MLIGQPSRKIGTPSVIRPQTANAIGDDTYKVGDVYICSVQERDSMTFRQIKHVNIYIILRMFIQGDPLTLILF